MVPSAPDADAPDTLHPNASTSSARVGPGGYATLAKQSLSFPRWSAELTGNVLRSRTPFSAYLTRTIQTSRLSRVSGSPAPTFFPIPLPCMGSLNRMTRSGSAHSKHNRHLSQVVLVIVSALNFWYAGGKHGDIELLRREPSRHHLLLYQRIRFLVKLDSDACVEELPKAGRRFPELAARLGELSDALTQMGASSNPYDKTFAGCEAPRDDDVAPQLKPYHDLDASKLKLFGQGKWDPSDFLDDELRMAFKEPKTIEHGQEAPPGPLIRDSQEALAALAQKWDDLDLLFLHRRPIHPSSPVRIFGAFKDASTHRQIGDRRGQNGLESKVHGPSRDLPAGPDFAELFIDPATQVLKLSITDRKDFYHQFACSESKAVSNSIGPPIPISMVKDTKAYAAFLCRDANRRYDRVRQGDRLKHSEDDDSLLRLPEDLIWASFRSILQGDHAGVELATQSHTNMLRSFGLLADDVQMKASAPLRAKYGAEGLVIDDYFAISIEPKEKEHGMSLAESRYRTAQAAYLKHGLLGSPQKDIIGSSSGKVIGAHINASQKALDFGIIPLASPPEKRLGLSHITFQVSQLGYTTDTLHLCLLGGWVSALGFRRPLMAILQKSFNLVDLACFDRNHPKIIHLPREIANELCLLATLMPLMYSDLAAPFSEKVFCTDASNDRGAVLEADISPELSEVLWKASRSKGAYTRLLSASEVLLKQLGELEEFSEHPNTEGPPRPLAYAFEFIEVFSGASKITEYASQMGLIVGPPLDLDTSPEYDLRGSQVIEWLTSMVARRQLLAFFLGPPCTTFSVMRRPRLRSRACPYGFEPSLDPTWTGNRLALRSMQLMRTGAQNESSGIIETPYSSYMKHLPPWQALKALACCQEIRTDSCRFGSCHLKSFRFLGLRVEMSSLALRCHCQTNHVRVEGALTKESATYTDALARELAKVFVVAVRAQKIKVANEHNLNTKGLECQLSNEVMLTSNWKVKASWSFKKPSHINILEEASLLRLLNGVAKQGNPVRLCALVDSNVIRCATAKGRTSSLGLSPVLRRVSAVSVAAGIYTSIPFTPTRLNCADDPTRLREVRTPIPGLRLEDWTRDQLFDLAALPKTKRWAANWVRLVLRLLGPCILKLHRRDLYRQENLQGIIKQGSLHNQMDFDCTLGYPGEGPVRPFPFSFMLWIFACVTFGFLSGLESPSGHASLLLVFVWISSSSVGGCFCCCGLLWNFHPAMAMPVWANTPGEKRKSALRRATGPLQLGRPVTEATNKARQKYWELFEKWTVEQGIDLPFMLDYHQQCIEEINIILVKFGRQLYNSGKSYNQYAETLNALGALKPSMRRMLQQAWDLGYSWMRNEPSAHHVAVPIPIILSLVATALCWGWTRVAGCLALGFSGLLRPGEITGAFRRDLLLPRDVSFSTAFALLSIREPKSRFTYARHQSAKVDCEDFLRVIDLAFGALSDGEKLWPMSSQTLRMRFKALLQALHLPTEGSNNLRCLDLGSLRSGGATFVIQVSENAELLRRRGRWASYKMMDIYIQETMALQYMKHISPVAKNTVLQIAASFTDILCKTERFAFAKIPTTAWYLLLSKWKMISNLEMGEKNGEQSFYMAAASFTGSASTDLWQCNCKKLGGHITEEDSNHVNLCKHAEWKKESFGNWWWYLWLMLRFHSQDLPGPHPPITWGAIFLYGCSLFHRKCLNRPLTVQLQKTWRPHHWRRQQPCEPLQTRWMEKRELWELIYIYYIYLTKKRINRSHLQFFSWTRRPGNIFVEWNSDIPVEQQRFRISQTKLQANCDISFYPAARGRLGSLKWASRRWNPQVIFVGRELEFIDEHLKHLWEKPGISFCGNQVTWFFVLKSVQLHVPDSLSVLFRSRQRVVLVEP